ncbi:MAG TPA: hypothetical protein VGQ75_07265 [Thermoanaerobaculia bacterium]|jgi:hypothetical protein|nr:hypothetical protein [Thermoanaerobaculia bacterium]
MKKAIRIAMGSGVLVAGLATAGAPAADAQVRVGGTVRLPHGDISFSIGDRFPIGGYVPYGYDVSEDVDYGYGFEYEDQWIRCEPRGSRWIIVAEPVFYGHRDYGYRDYGYRDYGYRDYRYSRPYRNDRYSRDYRRYDGRYSRRDDRWRRDDRSNRRDDRRHRDGDRRWNR